MAHAARVATRGQDSPDLIKVESALRRLFPEGALDRVLLVNPPDGNSELFQPETALRGRYANYPPYGILLIAEHLRRRNIEVRICNLNNSILESCRDQYDDGSFDFDAIWRQELKAGIEDFAPDLIGVTCMFTMTHLSFSRVCDYAAAFDVPVAVGGVHVSNNPERILDDIKGIDIAFLKEADVAIELFCDVVRGAKPASALAQVILSDGDERHSIAQPAAPDRQDISVLPAYDLIDIGRLSEYGTIGNFYALKPEGSRFATVLSNRGCRAQCTFCSVRNFNGRGVRHRDVDSVLDELQYLEEVQGINHIVWLDDDLLKDQDRALQLFNGKIKRGLKMTWDATNGVIASSCDDQTVHAMAESGCIALNIGMESGNPQILRQVKKPGTVDVFLRAAETLKRYPSIHARVFLMLGFPNETLAMIGDTINVARQMDMDWCGITALQPLPNTPIYDAMIAQGLIEATETSEVRFMSGGFGKQNELETGQRLATVGFAEAFEAIPLDAIPTREQIDDIWFFMNYHLNFHRLFGENRIQKLQQLRHHLNNLCDVISPEHGFALYFLAYLEHKLEGSIAPATITRLEGQLSRSSYWKERLEAFDLTVADLHAQDFKNKDIPRLMIGELPGSLAAAAG